MSILRTSAVPAKSAPLEAPLFSWTLPPVGGWGLLTIRGTLYRLREVHYDESDGTPRMLVRLMKAGGTEYQLSPNADCELCCDCPDAIYREREYCCKHVTAVRAAYAEIDRQARLAEFFDSDPEAATLKLLSADGAMMDAPLDTAEALAADVEVLDVLDSADALLADLDAETVLNESARTGEACGIVRRKDGAA